MLCRVGFEVGGCNSCGGGGDGDGYPVACGKGRLYARWCLLLLLLLLPLLLRADDGLLGGK
jgi:hypothetical protein